MSTPLTEELNVMISTPTRLHPNINYNFNIYNIKNYFVYYIVKLFLKLTLLVKMKFYHKINKKKPYAIYIINKNCNNNKSIQLLYTAQLNGTIII